MYDKGNWDFDHREEYRTSGHVPYAMLDRSHADQAHSVQDRKRNTSTVARQRHKSTANKHTRQYLNNLMNAQLAEVV